MKLKDLFIVFASAILTLVSCEEDNIKEEAVKLVTAELTFSDGRKIHICGGLYFQQR